MNQKEVKARNLSPEYWKLKCQRWAVAADEAQLCQRNKLQTWDQNVQNEKETQNKNGGGTKERREQDRMRKLHMKKRTLK